jgi:hypothetical protein
MKIKKGGNTNFVDDHFVLQLMGIRLLDDSPTWRLLLQTRTDELDTMKSTVSIIVISKLILLNLNWFFNFVAF